MHSPIYVDTYWGVHKLPQAGGRNEENSADVDNLTDNLTVTMDLVIK